MGPDLQIDVDELDELEPDLVLAAESVPGMEEVNERVREAGFEPLVLAPTSLDEVQADIVRIGEALGVPERAERLVEAVQQGLEEVREALASVEPVRVYWEWWPDPPITAGAGGWTTEVVELAGGENVFADRPEHSLETSLDEIQEREPGAVCLCWQGALHQRQSVERFLERDGGRWGQLEAAQAGRIHERPEAVHGRPGPRLVEGARQLAAELHPDRADRLPDAYAWLPDALKDPLPL